MTAKKAARLLAALSIGLATLGMAGSAEAQENKNQEKKIKIGVIFDLTGPLAGGGSRCHFPTWHDT